MTNSSYLVFNVALVFKCLHVTMYYFCEATSTKWLMPWKQNLTCVNTTSLYLHVMIYMHITDNYAQHIMVRVRLLYLFCSNVLLYKALTVV